LQRLVDDSKLQITASHVSAMLADSAKIVLGAVTGPHSASEEHEPCIISHGDRFYSIGASRRIAVTENEDLALQALLRSSPRTLDSFQRETNKDGRDVAKSLRGLKNGKYDGLFAPAIQLPGRRGRGGYQANVRPENPPISH
jgi:hypothetical protein